MIDKKKNSRVILIAVCIIFCTTISFLFKVSLIDSKKYYANSYNPRISKKNSHQLIKKGYIYDSKNNLLVKNSEDGTRIYLYPEIFSHTIGYETNGGFGIEKKYHYEMTHTNFIDIIQNFFDANTANAKEIFGKDIYLTINKNLQEFVYNQLDKFNLNGAIVILQPNTGKILAMVSRPSFNPNDIKSFMSEEEKAPLLNRATQGLYPPGSVFKIITSMAAFRHLNLEQLNYNCHGKEKFDGDIIHCFNSHIHGKENIKKAFAVSCNTFFATLGNILGENYLLEESEKLYMNKDFPFELEHNKATILLDKNSSQSELIQTSIGQGKTSVTPLYMAMITSAIANGGKMMQPYLVDKIGKNVRKPKEISQIMTADETDFLKDLMEEVVVSGTATKIKNKNIKLAGKTGSAENSFGKDHGWFVVFDSGNEINSKFAMSILLENSDGSRKAVDIANNIIKFILDK